MPRLSLYRPEKGNDYKFIDRSIWEMFQIGGTDIFVHKYVGPKSSTFVDETPTTPKYNTQDPTQIQDMLFLENRDRKYDPDVYVMRGVYNLQDLDFNLSQFGLFLQNDTVFVTFHINDTVEKIGRKLMSGDVIELPHLKDEHALNDLNFALKRFYVIEEVTRAAEGYSVTWYPHLYRAKCTPLVDSQEFKDILDGVAGDDTNLTLRDVMSTYEKEMQITSAVLDQAESDAPYSGYSTAAFYTVQVREDGTPELITVDSATVASSNTAIDISLVLQTAEKLGYDGYLLGDGTAPNGAPFTSGIAFPIHNQEGQYHLRTDYKPNRLFRYTGKYWSRIDDMNRATMSNLGPSDTASGERFEGKSNRNTQKATFVNNPNTDTINGKTIDERQSLSKALRPKADN